MKKVFLTLALVSMVVCFASCGKKTCYCYTTNLSGTTEETVTIDEDESCVALSGVTGQGARVCVEEENR